MIGLPDIICNYNNIIKHFSAVNITTNDIWLYLSKEIVAAGVISGEHAYTREPFTDTIMEWILYHLSHEFIHIICKQMNEDSQFDPICGLGLEGL